MTSLVETVTRLPRRRRRARGAPPARCSSTPTRSGTACAGSAEVCGESPDRRRAARSPSGSRSRSAVWKHRLTHNVAPSPDGHIPVGNWRVPTNGLLGTPVRVALADCGRRRAMVDRVIAVFAPGQGAQSPGHARAVARPARRRRRSSPGSARPPAWTCAASAPPPTPTRSRTPRSPSHCSSRSASSSPRRLGLDAAGERVVAGHSVGELTAAAVAGALTADGRRRLRRPPRREMAAACALAPTGMSAVLGGDAGRRPRRHRGRRADPGQPQRRRPDRRRRFAGRARRASPRTRPAGARVRPLAVAGAFHTHYMAPRRTRWREYAAGLTDRATRVRSCCPTPTARRSPPGPTSSPGWSRQVTLPVRWDLCLATCADLGVTAAIELAPGGTLTGIAKRELKGVELLAIKHARRPRAAAAAWSPAARSTGRAST